jgi:uncharacterized membrane protein YfhO
MDEPTYAIVNRISETANHISVEADGPGFLVLSEIYYPGWTATIDGKSIAIIGVVGLLRGVPLDNGHHLIEFSYQPALLYVGAILALIAWIFFGIFLLMKR